MRTSATSAVYASSAVDSPVIRSIIVFSSDHRAIGPGASGSVHAIGTDDGMGLIAEGKTADQNQNCKCEASHWKLRLFPSRIRRLLLSTVPNNVTVINTRDEHGDRFIPIGKNAVAFEC